MQLGNAGEVDYLGQVQQRHRHFEVGGQIFLHVLRIGHRRNQHLGHRDVAKLAVEVIERALQLEHQAFVVAGALLRGGAVEAGERELDAAVLEQFAAAGKSQKRSVRVNGEQSQAAAFRFEPAGKIALSQFGDVDDLERNIGVIERLDGGRDHVVSGGHREHLRHAARGTPGVRDEQRVHGRGFQGIIDHFPDAPAHRAPRFLFRHVGSLHLHQLVVAAFHQRGAAKTIEPQFPPQALQRRDIAALGAIGLAHQDLRPRRAGRHDVRHVHAIRPQIDAQPARRARGGTQESQVMQGRCRGKLQHPRPPGEGVTLDLISVGLSATAGRCAPGTVIPRTPAPEALICAARSACAEFPRGVIPHSEIFASGYAACWSPVGATPPGG